MGSQDEYFQVVLARGLVRPSVRAIVIAGGHLLVQRPSDSPDSPFAFIGGEYEAGDTFESRLRREFAEETNAEIVSMEYRFVFENRFLWKGGLIHCLEHYFEVTLNRFDIESREPNLRQHWLPMRDLPGLDIRPSAVRNVIADGSWLQVHGVLPSG